MRSKSSDAESRGNTKTARCTAQMLSLLQESEVKKLIPLHEASDYYFDGLEDVSRITYTERKSISSSLKLDFLTVKMVCQL